MARFTLALTALIVLIVGCQPDGGDSLSERVYNATQDAWYAGDNLPSLKNSGDHCGHLDYFEMKAPATEESFIRTCPRNQLGQLGWACLKWELLPRARSVYRPVAVMHPKLSSTRWAAHGIHELLHAFLRCRNNGVPPDQDYFHTILEVWEKGGPNSVETRAERTLDAPPMLQPQP